MTQFRITAPDGTVYNVTAPEGATEQDALARVQAQHQPATQAGGADTQPAVPSMPMTGRYGAVKPSWGQQLQASPIGEIGYGLKMGLQGPAQLGLHAAADLTGNPTLKDITQRGDAGMAQDTRSQQLARTLMETDKMPTWANPGEMIGEGVAQAPIAALGGPGGAIGGAIFGALSPVKDAKDNFWGQKAVQTGSSAMIGKTLGRLGADVPQAPTKSELNSMSQDAFKASEDMGVIIPGKKLQPLVEKTQNDLAELAIDEVNQPKAFRAFTRLADVAKNENVTLKGLETVRKTAQNVLTSQDKTERMMAHTIIDNIDDYVHGGGLKPEDTLSGNPQVAGAMLQEGRDLWRRKSNAETIERLIEKAKNRTGANYTVAGYETALRQQFSNLAGNEKAMRFFKPDEKAAILKVVRGGPVENTLRFFGKFAPRGLLGTVMSAGAGAAMGGDLGMLAFPAVGEVGRFAATAGTLRNVHVADELMRAGVKPTAATATGPQQLTAAALARLLTSP